METMSKDAITLSAESCSPAAPISVVRSSCNVTTTGDVSRYANAECMPSSSVGGTITSLRVASPSATSVVSGHAARHSPKDVDSSRVRSPAGAVGAGGSYSSSSRSMTASRRASVTERHVTERPYGHKRTASGDVGVSWSTEALGLASPASTAATPAPHSRYHQVLSYNNRRSNAAVTFIANEHSKNHAAHMSNSPSASPRLSKAPSNKVLKHADAHPTIPGAEQQEKQQDAQETTAQLVTDSSHTQVMASGDAEAVATAAVAAAEVAAEVVAIVRPGSLSAHASFQQCSATADIEGKVGSPAEADGPPSLPLLQSLGPPSIATTAEAASPSEPPSAVSSSPRKEHSSRLWGFGSPKKEKSSGKIFSHEPTPTKERSSGQPWGPHHAHKDKSSSSSGSGSGATLTKKDSKNKLWNSDAAARAVVSLFGSDGLNALKKSLSGSSRAAALAATAGTEEDIIGSDDGTARGAVPPAVKGSTDSEADCRQLSAVSCVNSSSMSEVVGEMTAVKAERSVQAPTAALQVVAISVATLPAATATPEETQENASVVAAAAQLVPPSPTDACSAATTPVATEAPQAASPHGISGAAAASSALVGTSGDYRYSELLFRLQQFLPALKRSTTGCAEDFEATWELLKVEMTGLVSTAKIASLQAARLEALDAEVMQLQRLLVEVGSSIQSGAQQQQLQHLVQSFPSFTRRKIDSSTASLDAAGSGVRAAGPLMSPAVKPTSKFPAALTMAAANPASRLKQAPAAAATKGYDHERNAGNISPATQSIRYNMASELMETTTGSSSSRSPGAAAARGGIMAAGRSLSPSPGRCLVLPPVPKELTPGEAAQLTALYRAVRNDPERIACRTLKVPPRSHSSSPTHPDRDSSPRRSASPQLPLTRRSAAAAGVADFGLNHFASSLYGQHSPLQSTTEEIPGCDVAGPASGPCCGTAEVVHSSWEYAVSGSSTGHAGVPGVAKGFRAVNSIPESHRRTMLSAAGDVRRNEGASTGGGQTPVPVSSAKRISSLDPLSCGSQQATRDRPGDGDSSTSIARLSDDCNPIPSQEATVPVLEEHDSVFSAINAEVEHLEDSVVAVKASETPNPLSCSIGSTGYEYVRARSASPNLGMRFMARSPVLKTNKSPVTAARRRGVGSANLLSCSLGSIPSSRAGASAVEGCQATVSGSSDGLGSFKAAFEAAHTGIASVPVLADDPAFKRACQAFQGRQESDALHCSLSSSDSDTLAGSRKLAAKLASSPVKDANSTQVDAAMNRLTSELQEHGVSLDIKRLGPWVYSTAGRKLRLRMVNGILLVRTGGGCVDLLAALGKLPTGGKVSSTNSSPLNSRFVVRDDDNTSYLASSTAHVQAARMVTALTDGTIHGMSDGDSRDLMLNVSKAAVLSHHLGRLTLEHVPDDPEASQTFTGVVGRKCEGGELGCDALPLALSVGGDAWADIVAEAGTTAALVL